MPNVYISEFVTIYKTKTVVSVSPWTLAPCLHLTSVGSGQPSWPPLAHSINTAPRVESAYQSRIHRSRGFDSWIRKIPWKRKWQPTLVFLPGKSHGQRGQAGCSPWGCKESDKISQLGTSLVVQWLRLCAPNAAGLGSTPCQETKC